MKITVEVHDKKLEFDGDVETFHVDVSNLVRIEWFGGNTIVFGGTVKMYNDVCTLLKAMSMPEPPPAPVPPSPPSPRGWPCFCTGPDDKCENCAAGEAVLRCEFNVHGRACGDIARHVSKGVYLCDEHIVEVSRSWDH